MLKFSSSCPVFEQISVFIFKGNLDELSIRLREVSQNQIDIQCQLIKLNLNPNMTKFLRRAISFDTADNVPVLLCNSKHDSGVNVNTDHEEHVNFKRESVVENSPSNDFHGMLTCLFV